MKLLLLRHGQSTANAEDSFSGWMDVPLSGRGEKEADAAAAMMRAAGLLPSVVHTSLLQRSVRTAEIVMARLDRSWVPVTRSWRLNERHYGLLQGRGRAEVLAEVGEETFMRWRRSYHAQPPPAGPADTAALARDPRYACLPPGCLPDAESLADVQRRLLPHWQDALAADVATGRLPLVVAHGNSLRALCVILDRLGPDEVETLNIPTGIPLLYELTEGWRPVVRGGVYLDPGAAERGVAEVAAQGRAGLRVPGAPGRTIPSP
ncbi:MAG TPA: 2,3-bisphosphoglycerate-dependent phosphoglycerate mutase [Acidimicrobiales bacterium]|nr:2,3-bisphosphoglycerate-dependent phosphoglycerate mutase [Acidimicrobiales bacterium]